MVLCSAFGCKNVGTHLFPKETKLKKQWEVALKRKSFQASEHSRLCSSHFQPEDFLKEGFHSGVQSKRKILKKGTVPSVFLWKKSVLGESTTERGKRAKAHDIRRQLLPQEISEEQPEVSRVVEVSTQDASAEEDVEVKVPQFKHIGTQKNYVLYTIESFRGDDKGVHFYTGLESYEKFMFVLSTLTPEAYSLQFRWKQVLNISVEDQFLLTLMKLRRNKEDYELARFFDMHPSSVSNIFVTWINFMHQMWEMLDIWPSRKLVNFYMPEGFAESYPSTRVIVDCTEIPVQKPSNPAAQQVLWSSYRNHSTVKLEVGATPSGLLSHCSEAYGGSTSDRQMIERSSLLQKCERGDSIMADRGLNVQDLFAAKGVSLNIPTFLKGKSQLPGIKVLQDRKLSSKRVHIERAIGLTKTYKMLQAPVNHSYIPLMSKIYFVCQMLCNFREGIVSNKA